MKTIALILSLMVIGLSASSQVLIQPYQIKIGTNQFALMTGVGCTNMEQFVKWQGANWHTKAGYASTNDVNAMTNQLNSLSNQVVTARGDMNNLTNTLANYINVTTNRGTVVLLATNTTAFTIPKDVMTIINTGWGEIRDTKNAFSTVTGRYTIPTNGIYLIIGGTVGENDPAGSAQVDRDFCVAINDLRIDYHSGVVGSSQSGMEQTKLMYLTAGQTVALGMFHESPYPWKNYSARLSIMHIGD